ncbi:MAG: efflux transporter periplasmic adaptor subunit [Alphaproteobacteria bacterium 64-11]|nr:efflux RND transporter periplasmic adaptor subunit [Alphaproteobacteria bacterium]OJU10971.1 MAG: efflux transporter periplasmic adaptor subunit [Alphaproteobacteria bacterium 64-11]
MANPRSRRSLLFGAAALAVLGGGWFVVHHMASADATPVAAAVQAAPVNTVTLEPQKAQIWSEFSGRLDPVDYAEVRPQVSGRITEIRFKDGQTVKAGDVLFVIDPRPYQAAAAKAAADLRSAQTNAALAKANLARAESLRKAGAIALQSYDQAANASAVANAAIGAAQATLTQAQLDVGYAYVKAPISGKVSRAEITVGNLVQNQPSAPLLTSIVSKDGIYADFEVDEQTYVRGIHSAADTQSEQQKIPVELTLPGDSGHVYKGFIESFDNHIDTGSGTIRARARFDNSDGALVPGMFVSVRIANASGNAVLLVPERAIGTDQSKRFVYVVDNAGKAAFREVTLGATVGANRVVTSGLSRGDRVIVDGIQHIQPGAPVAATEISNKVAAQ